MSERPDTYEPPCIQFNHVMKSKPNFLESRNLLIKYNLQQNYDKKKQNNI